MRIAIYTLGDNFDGDSLELKSMGGAESAVAYIARELAKLENTVHVYCNCRKPGIYKGVEYRSAKDITAVKGYDVLIASRWPTVLTRSESILKVFWSHDMPALVEQVVGSMWCMDLMIFISDYHLCRWLSEIPKISRLSWVSRNGVDGSLVNTINNTGRARKLNRFVWASRPERGLDFLLEKIWPRLHEKLPNYELVICGYDGVEEPGADIYSSVGRLVGSTPGVVDYGNLRKIEFYELLASSKMLLYPSRYPEASCIAALEAQALGTPVATTANWALTETVNLGILIAGTFNDRYVEEFVNSVYSYVMDTKKYKQTKRKLKENTLTWAKIAKAWNSKFLELLVVKRNKFVEKIPLLSLCIITKNESENILRAINSAKPYVDEIIVLDTGSEDDTVKICVKERINVISYEPFGDKFSFSEARNQSIKKAKGKWILWMDADEVLSGGEHLKKYLDTNTTDAYMIQQTNLMLSSSPDVQTPIRLFRNNRGVQFRGVVHEEPAIAQSRIPLISDVEIVHFGYLDISDTNRKYRERNRDLLEQEKKVNPTRPDLKMLGMRASMNDAMIHLQDGKLEDAGNLLCAVVEGWRKHYNLFSFSKSKIPAERVAWETYQKTLSMLNEIGFKVDGKNIPRKYACSMAVAGGKKITEQFWYVDKAEVLDFLTLNFDKLEN